MAEQRLVVLPGLGRAGLHGHPHRLNLAGCHAQTHGEVDAARVFSHSRAGDRGLGRVVVHDGDGDVLEATRHRVETPLVGTKELQQQREGLVLFGYGVPPDLEFQGQGVAEFLERVDVEGSVVPPLVALGVFQPSIIAVVSPHIPS